MTITDEVARAASWLYGAGTLEGVGLIWSSRRPYLTGPDDQLPRRRRREPPLHGLVAEPGRSVGVQGHQRIHQGAEMAGISGKARRMAEDKSDVLRPPPQRREVGDVLGDKHALVEVGDGKQRRVAEAAEFRELLDGNGVDASLAEPVGSGRRVHLIEEQPHAG